MFWVAVLPLALDALNMCMDGIMKSGDNQGILQHNVQPSVRKLGLRRSWVLQPDKDPKHTSKSTQEWFKTKRLDCSEVASNESRSKSH